MGRTMERPDTPAEAGEKSGIVVARGDGIGPEIMNAVLRVLDAAGASLAISEIEIGNEIYQRGITSGIEPAAWDVLRQTGVFLKAPITTPLGSGYKSLNVTARKTLSLYANVRPVRAYAPFVRTKHPGMDVVIVRENEEDTYGGIEHMQTDEVAQCLKLITRPGSERIARYAFEYARSRGRKKVSCFTKQNIMKITDGLFYQVFREVAEEYPEVESDHWLIDIGTAMLADQPERFDIIVTPNLYGDIISDVAAQLAGSVGLAGSANIGRSVAMFEAVHGSAPDIAGKGVANPSGLLNAAVMMLNHLGLHGTATDIQNAWLCTIESGIHTADFANDDFTKKVVGTEEFASEVMKRLGQLPHTLDPVEYRHSTEHRSVEVSSEGDGGRVKPGASQKTLVGVDVFLDWDEAARDANVLGEGLEALLPSTFKLVMITNRGTKVYPDGFPETYCTDHWRSRFRGTGATTQKEILDLLAKLTDAGYEVIKTENLYQHGDQDGFSKGQGE